MPKRNQTKSLHEVSESDLVSTVSPLAKKIPKVEKSEKAVKTVVGISSSRKRKYESLEEECALDKTTLLLKHQGRLPGVSDFNKEIGAVIVKCVNLNLGKSPSCNSPTSPGTSENSRVKLLDPALDSLTNQIDGTTSDDEGSSNDFDDDDSNDENNWRNEYPDDEERNNYSDFEDDGIYSEEW